MQKAFIALTLALTLSCAFATYSTTNWVKTPVQILNDTDSNFTNASNLALGGLSTSDVNVIAANVTASTSNASYGAWLVWTKAIATKDLSSSSNTSYSFNAGIGGIYYGYAIAMAAANDTNNVPQIWLFQTKLNGGTVLPGVALTTNTVANYTPVPLLRGMAAAGWKNVAFFYLTSTNTKVNYTSITIGGSKMGNEYTLSTTWNTSSDSISCDWGEALSSSQVFCAYTEAGVYKVAVVDFSSGTYIGQGSVAGSWGKTMNCKPYVTDKKYYGLFCTNITGDGKGNNNITLFVSSNTTTNVTQMAGPFNNTIYATPFMHQYGPYLAVFSLNPSGSNGVVVTCDIWDTSALVNQFPAKASWTYDVNSTVTYYTIPQGGMYGLLYNTNGAVPQSSIFVGQILGASYLTTVFSALMTIIAGLFLF